MKTFEQFARQISSVSVSTSWYLADLGEALEIICSIFSNNLTKPES